MAIEAVDARARGLRPRRAAEAVGAATFVRRLDWLLLGAVAGIVGYGLWAIDGITRHDPGGSLAARQGLYAFAGAVLMVVAIAIVVLFVRGLGLGLGLPVVVLGHILVSQPFVILIVMARLSPTAIRCSGGGPLTPNVPRKDSTGRAASVSATRVLTSTRT